MSKKINPWNQWLEDNYKYVVMGYVRTERDRDQVMKLATACEKHGVSFKTFIDIISEAHAEE